MKSFTPFLMCLIHISLVQSLSRARLFATPWTAACQASLSITNCRSLLKLMSIESVMPSNHLILCLPLLLPSSILPRIRVFSKESVLPIRCPKYWSFSFSISPSNEYSGLISWWASFVSTFPFTSLCYFFSSDLTWYSLIYIPIKIDTHFYIIYFWKSETFANHHMHLLCTVSPWEERGRMRMYLPGWSPFCIYSARHIFVLG